MYYEVDRRDIQTSGGDIGGQKDGRLERVDEFAKVLGTYVWRVFAMKRDNFEFFWQDFGKDMLIVIDCCACLDIDDSLLRLRGELSEETAQSR